MLEQYAIEAWEYIVFFRLEILAGVVLVALGLLKRRYDSNVVIAGYIKAASDAIAQSMSDKAGGNPADTSTRAKRRRKVRRGLAKQARKANRGKTKGNKNS